MEKKFWAKAAMLGVLAATGGQKDLNAQQKEPQKAEQTMREKEEGMMNAEENAKKFNEVEVQEYKKYLQTLKGSKDEKDVFTKLSDNHSSLKRQLLKLMTYGTDKNRAISKEAMKVWMEINKGIEERKKECSDAGKNYFDRIPPPPPLPQF